MPNMRDHSAEAVLKNVSDLIRLSSFLPGSLGSFSTFYTAISPDMPADLVPRPVSSPIPPAPVFRFNFDEGHAGRYSVPATDGASLDPAWVLRQPDPLNYISTRLTFHHLTSPTSPRHATLTRAANFAIEDAEPVPQPEPLPEAANSHPVPNDVDPEEDGAALENGESPVPHEELPEALADFDEDLPEVTIFIPGLNTVHEPLNDETTTVDRLIHYVRVLQAVPMAQLHLGTSFDQGHLHVDASSSPLFRALMNNPVVPASLKGVAQGAALTWDARQLDRLQAAFSKFNIIDTPIKHVVRDLLALLPTARHRLVLVAYSRGSIEVEAALRGWVGEQEEAGSSSDSIERLLRKLTVVTVGAATDKFPDGPAYLHISAWTDPLARSSGVQPGKSNSAGAGRDAVFLNCASPYHEEAFDNHNFGAVTAQYTALVLALSGARGFRDLWEKARDGTIVEPNDADDLTRAMIQMTMGYEWLWSPDAAWRDIPPGALPEPDEAEALLRDRVGDKFVEAVKINFPRDG